MLTELCQYLRNWFCEDSDIVVGTIVIGGGVITAPDCVIQQGQYIRIVGSIFNDGVVQYGTDELSDETFEGSIWLMKVPKVVQQLAEDIAEWQAKYGGINSKAMSPFTSESFAGYSYSKSSGNSYGSEDEPTAGWQSAFAPRLAPWRKL